MYDQSLRFGRKLANQSLTPEVEASVLQFPKLHLRIMSSQRSQLQQINVVLGLLADVNRILTHPATQADSFQQMQYERQKQQYVAQLTDLLGATTQPLVVSPKRPAKAA